MQGSRRPRQARDGSDPMADGTNWRYRAVSNKETPYTSRQTATDVRLIPPCDVDCAARVERTFPGAREAPGHIRTRRGGAQLPRSSAATIVRSAPISTQRSRGIETTASSRPPNQELPDRGRRYHPDRPPENRSMSRDAKVGAGSSSASVAVTRVEFRSASPTPRARAVAGAVGRPC